MSGHAEIMRTAMKGLEFIAQMDQLPHSMAMMWMAPSQKQGYYVEVRTNMRSDTASHDG